MRIRIEFEWWDEQRRRPSKKVQGELIEDTLDTIMNHIEENKIPLIAKGALMYEDNNGNKFYGDYMITSYPDKYPPEDHSRQSCFACEHSEIPLGDEPCRTCIVRYKYNLSYWKPKKIKT